MPCIFIALRRNVCREPVLNQLHVAATGNNANHKNCLSTTRRQGLLKRLPRSCHPHQLQIKHREQTRRKNRTKHHPILTLRGDWGRSTNPPGNEHCHLASAVIGQLHKQISRLLANVAVKHDYLQEVGKRRLVVQNKIQPHCTIARPRAFCLQQPRENKLCARQKAQWEMTAGEAGCGYSTTQLERLQWNCGGTGGQAANNALVDSPA